ncbi:CBY1-interacting BAR domain-containing protein 1 isoform X2 [Manis pentadactyla]|uniref:CBY1-interacting BAR domain-containing protein 1 isoform X2 n=1 Tax=Manis pentadactyla TaxID=143292 RepID=UPI001875A867|nr:CBY1-interacting BAR domain-containing protein 1 isoform X2 [Manis pentadactyla]
MWRRSLENRDVQTRQLQDAVTNVEKHFGELCQIFAAYVRKTARLRDKADLLVERLEAKVVEPLKAYGAIVKMKRVLLPRSTRNHMSGSLGAVPEHLTPEGTALSSDLGLHQLPDPPSFGPKAETELQRATMDATRTTRHLEETIDNFEKQKIKDIKTVFSEFITIEMLFHGKALEVFTAAYQNIQKIDEEEDLEVFRNSLYPPDYSSRLDIVRANSKSPLQRSLSAAKCESGIGQVSTCRLRKDHQAEDDDEEDEDLDVTEEN